MMSHRARWIGLIASVLVFAIGTQAGADPVYTVTALSYRSPATPWTAGIASARLNDLGQVAGSYSSTPSIEVGFQYDDATGKVTTLPAPSSTATPTLSNPSETFISGQNNSGQMIGFQIPSGGTYTTGFLDTNGQFSTLPGTPTAINNNGQVAGEVGYVNGQFNGPVPVLPTERHPSRVYRYERDGEGSRRECLGLRAK